MICDLSSSHSLYMYGSDAAATDVPVDAAAVLCVDALQQMLAAVSPVVSGLTRW